MFSVLAIVTTLSAAPAIQVMPEAECREFIRGVATENLLAGEKVELAKDGASLRVGNIFKSTNYFCTTVNN